MTADPHAFRAEDLIGAPRRSRAGLAFTLLLLFLACLPDAMLPPVLRALVVERFGASEPQAHFFMAINLVGALLALPVLYGVRRIVSPAILIVVGAALNAALLALLSASASLGSALVLRGLEGAADMIVLAVLLDVAARAGASTASGRRLGLSATVLMLGLAGGAVLGGLIGRPGTETSAAPGELAAAPDRTMVVLLTGSAACALLLVGALAGGSMLNRIVREGARHASSPPGRGATPLWVPALMMGSDRMLAGLLTTTIPLLLASRLDWSPERIGGMLAVPLLLMAFGAYPAGLLADRLGTLSTRTVAALVYALAIATVPVVGRVSTSAMLATLFVLGFAAAALMPTALSITAATRRGAAGMGTVQACGNLGYLGGIAGAGWLLGLLGGKAPGEASYAMVITLFALLHVVATGITLVEGWSGRRTSSHQAETGA